MPDLEARSVPPAHPGSWRRALPDGPIALSRADLPPDKLPPGTVCWSVEWDKLLSRPHAFLWLDHGRLTVRRRLLPTPTTNLIFRGPEIAAGLEADVLTLAPGESFRIGDTVFTFHGPAPGDDAAAHDEQTFTRIQLQEAPYPDPDRRVEALASLPELIRSSPTDDRLEQQVLQVLLDGIRDATTVAVVRLPAGAEPIVSAARGRSPDTVPRPSRRLIAAALRDRLQGVLHVWRGGDEDVTRTDDSEWALCVPLLDEHSPDWGLYASGRFPPAAGRDAVLTGHLKFASLTADVFASLRGVRHLQGQRTILSQFLSPKVLTTLSRHGNVAEVLKARPCEVTVLMCDLRGSCRLAEDGAGDLVALWATVEQALTVMSGAIVEYDGVIGDFQGDAALGFWGWPLPEDGQVEQACRAALAIRRRFRGLADACAPGLDGMRCGIGIAHGPAIAGRIGTRDQSKVGVFGPVVNLTARIESLTKAFGVPVLVDHNVARAIAGADRARTRRVAKVRPAGMTHVAELYELLPAAVEPGVLTETQRQGYEAALAALERGKWNDAARLLKRLPADDGPSQYLRDFLTRQPEKPAEWDGVLTMTAK